MDMQDVPRTDSKAVRSTHDVAEDKKIRLEKIKIQADSVKHITTLATGTIVVIATFMDKLPKPLASPNFLADAIIAMLVCLTCSFILLWLLTLQRFSKSQHVFGFPLPHLHGKLADWMRSRLFNVLTDAVYFSYVIGVGCLGFFALVNIRQLQ